MSFSILIVDDSELIRHSLSSTIQKIDFPLLELFQAENGKEALAILETEWVDFIFTDMVMPEMGGAELIAKINASEDWKEIPIVVISSMASSVKGDDLRRQGVKMLIEKPFSQDSIRKSLLTCLGQW